jgi:hypothetical protein
MGVGVATEQIAHYEFSAVVDPEIVGLDLTPYSHVMVFINLQTVSTDDEGIRFQVTDDSGTTWATGTEYEYLQYARDTGNTEQYTNATASSGGIALTNGTNAGWGLGNAANENGSWVVHLPNPADSAWQHMYFSGSYIRGAGIPTHTDGTACRQEAVVVDGVRVQFNATTTFTGSMTVVGIRKTPVPATLPVFTGGQEVIAQGDLSGINTQITNLNFDNYASATLILTNVKVNTNDKRIYIRLSADNGSTWGSSDYDFAASFLDDQNNATTFTFSGGNTGIPLVDDAATWQLGNAANELGNWHANIYKLDGDRTHVHATGTYTRALGGELVRVESGGTRNVTGPIDAISIYSDGTTTITGQYMLVGQLKQNQETPLPRGHLYRSPENHFVELDTTDRDHDLVFIAPMHARDSTDTVNMRLTANMTKQIDAAWAAGNNAGGLFSGTVAASTTYHLFIIATASGDIDCGFDTDADAANIPAGWSYYRRIGSMRTDATSNFEQPWAVKVTPPMTGWTRTDSATTGGGENYAENDKVITGQNSGTGSRLQTLERTAAAPSTPYTVTAHLVFHGYRNNAGQYGIGFKDNTTGELHFLRLIINDDICEIEVGDWTDVSNFSVTRTGSEYTDLLHPSAEGLWFRITDDGTNLYYLYSYDGVRWTEIHNHARTVFLTPDRIFFANKGTQPSTKLKVYTICDSWHVA